MTAAAPVARLAVLCRGSAAIGAAVHLATAILTGQAQAMIINECRSLIELPVLSDESKLSEDDRLAIAAIRTAVAQDNAGTGGANTTPPTIYDFNSLFVALNPGLPANDEAFGERTLIVATRTNATTHSAVHRIRSPRFRFWSTVGSQVVTGLTFFGETAFEVRVSGGRSAGPNDTVSFEVLPVGSELEAALCGK
jgi:hypothetical protein